LNKNYDGSEIAIDSIRREREGGDSTIGDVVVDTD
jgi:hypothetical protein